MPWLTLMGAPYTGAPYTGAAVGYVLDGSLAYMAGSIRSPLYTG